MSALLFEEDRTVTTLPDRLPGSRAVRPRHAATLILVRRDQARPRVLLGRRHGGHSFMPDKWVFPGGRVDPADFHAPYATDLRPEVAEKLHMTAPLARARALGMAAIRETFEEAGLLLARPAPVRSAVGPWREFVAQGAQADLGALNFVARAITPPSVPKRFDARFFMAEADRLVSLEPQPDCGELDEIAWFTLKDAQDLDLPIVTRFVLREMEQRLEHPARPIPFMRFLYGASQLTHI